SCPADRGSPLGGPEDAAPLSRRPTAGGAGTRAGLGLAGREGALRRRGARVRAALPRRLGAEPLLLAVRAAARRSAVVRGRAARRARAARARHLDLRRQRRDE